MEEGEVGRGGEGRPLTDTDSDSLLEEIRERLECVRSIRAS